MIVPNEREADIDFAYCKEILKANGRVRRDTCTSKYIGNAHD